MRPVFNYTNEEKIKIIKFKNSFDDSVEFAYGFMPLKEDEQGNILFKHFVRAIKDGKTISTHVVTEKVEVDRS